MDFPGDTPTPLFVPSYSRYAIGHNGRILGSNLLTVSNLTWAAAGQAQYVPFSLPWHYPLRRMFWGNGSTVGGTATIGVYTEEGANLYRSAATTTAGTSALQYVSVSPPMLLPPGSYYVGLAFSGTTSVALGTSTMTVNVGRMLGLLQQSAIPAVDAAATFAQWNSTILGICGFTQTVSGF